MNPKTFPCLLSGDSSSSEISVISGASSCFSSHCSSHLSISLPVAEGLPDSVYTYSALTPLIILSDFKYIEDLLKTLVSLPLDFIISNRCFPYVHRVLFPQTHPESCITVLSLKPRFQTCHPDCHFLYFQLTFF